MGSATIAASARIRTAIAQIVNVRLTRLSLINLVFLLFPVDLIERIKERFDAGIRAPECQNEAGKHRKT